MYYTVLNCIHKVYVNMEFHFKIFMVSNNMDVKKVDKESQYI